MTPFLVLVSVSALSVILGFIALLSQKIYIDSQTNQPTEVEVPIFGKLKTNIPALVFVFLGFLILYISIERCLPRIYAPPKHEWKISGTFAHPLGQEADWENGQIALFPAEFEAKISPEGRFEIKGNIEEGKSFEDVIQTIDYTCSQGSVQISPREQLDKYNTQGASIPSSDCFLKRLSERSRHYESIPIGLYHNSGDH